MQERTTTGSCWSALRGQSTRIHPYSFIGQALDIPRRSDQETSASAQGVIRRSRGSSTLVSSFRSCLLAARVPAEQSMKPRQSINTQPGGPRHRRNNDLNLCSLCSCARTRRRLYMTSTFSAARRLRSRPSASNGRLYRARLGIDSPDHFVHAEYTTATPMEMECVHCCSASAVATRPSHGRAHGVGGG